MVETTGEIRKRNVAFKLRIGDVLKGVPMMDEGKFLFLELGDRKVVRVNMIANCVDKFIQEGEKQFGSLTVDDASGQLKLKVFGEDIARVKDIMQGDTLQVVGNMREWNGEIYMIPEVVKKVDARWLLVRKLEIQNARKDMPAEENRGVSEVKNLVLGKIKEKESEGGIDRDALVMDIEASPDVIEIEVKKLLEEGLVYEPRPGRLRYLG
ncbi:hypothetical protein HN903_03525 [archaeon]|jgi:RPA family protein|nr:hypothetical protein [archaeon]MBT7128800.1 hypothetical protein [archaeon]